MLNHIFAVNTLKVEFNGPEYWHKIQSGDKDVFENVFKTYYQVLCNYACSTVKDMDEAEEVVQNTFFNIWNKRDVLEVKNLKAYLYRAVHNDCLNKIKHAKVRQVYAADYKATANVGYDDASQKLQGKELSSQINKAIDSLPEQCCNVFKLSRFEHMKYAEIAEYLGISVKTVENHMGKALKLLRVQLKDYLPLLIFLLNLN
ncbi:MAG: RNA polymerase sigma-70 factor [Bacteroidota bacterium]|nr:RNA polymerase sigma-70 factor [Bacteroidota bacterium]